MEFSSNEVFTVVNEIHKLVFSDSNILKEHGVFRESGSKHHIETLIAQMLEPEQDHSISTEMSVHDYIGALKHVLLNRNDKFSNTVVRKFIHDLLSNRTRSFTALLTHLVHSKQKDNILLAESLYKYIQIIRVAASFQVENGMDAKNLGLMLGPVLSVSESMADVAFLNDYSTRLIQSETIPSDLKFIEFIANRYSAILHIVFNAKQEALKSATRELRITNNVIHSSTEILKSQNDFIQNKRTQLHAVQKSIMQQESRLVDASTKKPLRKTLTTSVIEEQKHAIELVQQIKIKMADKLMTQYIKQNAMKAQLMQMQKVKDLRTELDLVKKQNRRSDDMEDWSGDFESGASIQIKKIVRKFNQSASDEGSVFFKQPIKKRRTQEEKSEMPKLS